jgi:hypothetical protein
MVARLNTYIHVKLNSQFLRNENVYLHFTVLVNSVQQRQSLTYSNGSTSAGGCRACTLYETDPATMTTNQNKAIKLNSPIKRGHTTSWPIRTCKHIPQQAAPCRQPECSPDECQGPCE